MADDDGVVSLLALAKGYSDNESPLWRIVRSVILDTRVTEFLMWPAARGFHHAERGGLLKHTMETAQMAMKMGEQLNWGGAGVDMELLFVGALLHDVGKLEEYGFDPQTGSVWLTSRGRMEGHIALGIEMVDQAGRGDLDLDRWMALRHLILSHHGRKEWGSPVEPETPEAIVLHHADCCSAKVDWTLRRGREPGRLESGGRKR